MTDLTTQSDFMFYASKDGTANIQVAVEDDTVWVTQNGMAEIFDIDSSGISKHLKNIFESNELDKSSVVAKIATTGGDGKTYQVKYYNLDAIISVGYRVNSYKATRFRIWAIDIIKEYLVKGFAMDDERLKQGKTLFGKDYFDELLERIREIRSSERRFYLKVTDLYALSADYDKKSPESQDFFSSVQNKLHWAITGKTAAEFIYSSADAKSPNMGLRTWNNAPEGKILKSDTHVAKNYLDKDHIKELEGLVSAYLELAENRAKRHIVMKMSDWAKFLNNFLELSAYPALDGRGKISAEKAKIKANKEYKVFRIKQDIEYKSDFDRAVEQIRSTGTLPKETREKLKKSVTNFDKKLKKAINFNPKE